MYEKSYPKQRFDLTLKFMDKHMKAPARILDLGVPNPMSKLMEEKGHTIVNTDGQDLDIDYQFIKEIKDIEAVTGFEILEHLLSPLPLLSSLPAKKMFLTIPLKLWFAPAYRSKTDMWDRHYHEFEDWQFDWLIEKAGWKIIDSEKWIIKNRKIGLRPFLRNRTPRYYAIYAEKI